LIQSIFKTSAGEGAEMIFYITGIVIVLVGVVGYFGMHI
jgi:hypothetical protein